MAIRKCESCGMDRYCDCEYEYGHSVYKHLSSSSILPKLRDQVRVNRISNEDLMEEVNMLKEEGEDPTEILEWFQKNIPITCETDPKKPTDGDKAPGTVFENTEDLIRYIDQTQPIDDYGFGPNQKE